MSLVNNRIIGICAAGALAAGIPYWLLRPRPIEIDAPLPPLPTRLSIAPVRGLDMAIAAPPFTPSRQPIGIEPLTASPEVAPAPPVPPPTPPTLVGLVVASRGKAVALLRGTSGETVTLSRGESVDGWTLLHVSRDEAVLQNGETRRSVQLDYGNRPVPGGTPAAPPFPSLPERDAPLTGPLIGGHPEN